MSRLSGRLTLVLQLGSLLALLTPIAVSLWLGVSIGRNLPPRVEKLETDMLGIRTLTETILAMKCLETDLTGFEAIQLNCGAVTKKLGIAYTIRPNIQQTGKQR